MALKNFCQALKQCAEKLEEEIRYNINEFNNLSFGKNMDELNLALERAKDYHYEEIVNAVTEILKQVKVIVFHHDQIEWLSNKSKFTAGDLKRFSYVRRQVYAFSNPEEKSPFSRSEENLAVSRKIKRDKRRTASEVSIGTLEAWEKYLDHKERDENQIEQDIIEVKKIVPKRMLSNARARKKFVSSTLGGFLDDPEGNRSNLESIVETTYSTGESDDNDDWGTSYLTKGNLGAENQLMNENNYVNPNLEEINRDLIERNAKAHITLNTVDVVQTNDKKDSKVIKQNIENNINTSIDRNIIESPSPKNDAAECGLFGHNNGNAGTKTFLGEGDESQVFSSSQATSSYQPVDKVKPKVVSVIYKKKSS